YRGITFVKGTNLDKKGSLCLPDPPVIQSPCRDIFGIEKLSKYTSKQPKIAEEERHALV
ncbi:hypothetical protein J1N35_005664, partial [Gossypium stocksii]